MRVPLTGVLSRTYLARSAETHQVTRAGNLICTGDTAYVTGYLIGQSLDTSTCLLPLTAYIQSYILSETQLYINYSPLPRNSYKVMN